MVETAGNLAISVSGWLRGERSCAGELSPQQSSGSGMAELKMLSGS
jgi:hypothetical protein